MEAEDMAQVGNDVDAGPFRSLSGWMPLVFAGAALALLGSYWVTGPHAPDMVMDHGRLRPDEGVAAHLWQLLMLAQLVAIAVFLVRWAAKSPKAAMLMLALQLCGLVAAALPVWLLEH
jgi:hypothetical protein